MEWTRIQTSLLLQRTPERDLTAIVKYQLLWADREEQPTDEMALRHMTKNQLERAKTYFDSISAMVKPDIRTLNLKRCREKKNYNKNKELNIVSTNETMCETTNVKYDETTSHIKEEQNESNKNIKTDDLNKPKFPPVPSFL